MRRNWPQENENKSTESQERLMSWYWKWKPTWRKDLITYNSHPRIMFPFNWLVITWRGGSSFEIGRPGSSSWKNFGRSWTKGWGSWKLDNFHGRHMCIVPKLNESNWMDSNEYWNEFLIWIIWKPWWKTFGS